MLYTLHTLSEEILENTEEILRTSKMTFGTSSTIAIYWLLLKRYREELVNTSYVLLLRIQVR